METYAGTGLVRFEYKHFAFIGEESIRAAEASECANEQGQFWQYHDTLFLNQGGTNQGAYRDIALKAFAASLGLDEDEFDRCLDSRRFRDLVRAETQEGDSRGVDSTPTILINDQMIQGALAFAQYQSIIEAELTRLSAP